MKRMKRWLSLLLTISMLMAVCITDIYAKERNEGSGARQEISLDGTWSFIDPDVGSAVDVQVPHSWDNFKSAYNLMANIKTCSYEKTVDVSSFAGKKLFIQFEGVNKTAVVSVDGTEVGKHTGGFSAFAMDITDECAGKDQVTIRVDVTNIDFNTMPVNSDFTHFAGIYRDVRLVAVDSSAYIATEDYGSDGVYLYTDVNLADGSASLTPHVMVSYDYERTSTYDTEELTVKTTLSDAQGNVVKSTEKSINVAGSAAAEEVVLPKITVENAHLWNGTADPYLYSVTTGLYKNGELVDVSNDRIGFRKFQVKGGEFYLNGNLYELHGVGMHQEFGAETNATTDAQKAADIDMVLEMGANALRTCHYPHDQYIYDLCDEKGILVWNEIPFYLVMLNTDEFKNNAKDSAFEMVKQGYNHPSVMVWGIQNEVNYYESYMPYYPTQANPEQLGSFIKELAAEVHELDPSRMIGQAEIDNSSYAKETAGWTTADSNIDVVGFNIYTGWYSNVNGATESNKVDRIVNSLQSKLSAYQDTFNAASGNTTSYVLTEYGAGANVNHHDALGEEFKWGGTDSTKGYITTGNFHPEEYQSYVHEGMKMAIYGDETKAVTKADNLWAAFAWSMFDFSCYRNEGDTTRLNTKGLVTADRQTKKDAFYFYKANWNTEDYFTHICSSRMSVREEKTIDVKVYSNCESVDLIVNGKNLGAGIKQQDGVFVWKDVELKNAGRKNTVEAVGSQNGETCRDICDSWVYEGDVETGEHYAYIIGYKNGKVHPEADITRAETATLFFRILSDDQREEYFTKTNSYSDVNEGKWYNNAISTLSNAEIILGYQDHTFKPNEKITREEFAAMASRFNERTDYQGEDLFTDISGNWASEYINSMAEEGIIQGYPDETFQPQKNITRAEAITMINRLLKRTPDADGMLSDMVVRKDNTDTSTWYYADIQEATNSHKYKRGDESDKEIWIEIIENKDWSQYQK